MNGAGQKVKIGRMRLNNGNKSNRLYVSHCFKIVWIKKGNALWNIGGELCRVEGNDVVLLNNEEVRRIMDITSREDLEFLVVEFEPRFLFDSDLLPLFLQRINGYSHRIIDKHPEITGLLRRIDEEDSTRGDYSEVIVEACTLQILALAARQINLLKACGIGVNDQMRQVLAYIDKSFTRPVRLSDLAGVAHMSTTAFSRYFTKCNGIGPVQYIKRKRIEYAVYLLEHTERTVLDIGMECGFQNISNFYKAFQALTLKNPGAYRIR